MKSGVVIHSVKWSIITELLAKILTPITNLVLARLLAPEVFGVVASLTIVTSLADTFTEMGFQKYLIQHEFTDEKEFDGYTNVAFWSVFFIAVGIVVLIGVFRAPIAAFVGSEGYGNEMFFLSTQIPLVAYSGIQISRYRRDFRFKDLLPIRVVNSFVYIATTITVAIVLKNSWAIIVGCVSRECINAILLTRKSLWKPRFFYSFEYLKNMLSESLWMMADSMIIWVTSNIDTFILTHRLSSHYLGIYKQGIVTIRPYVNLVFAMMAPVLFATLSRVGKDKEERDFYLLQFQRYTAYIALPLGFCSFIFRDLLTYVLLGEQWSEASLLLGIIGLTSAINVIIGQYYSEYYRAAGNPQMALLVQTIYAIALILTILFFSEHSFMVLCMARGIVEASHSIISGMIMKIRYGIGFGKIIKNITLPLFSSFVFLCIGGVLLTFRGDIFWSVLIVFLVIGGYGLIFFNSPNVKKDFKNLIVLLKDRNSE